MTQEEWLMDFQIMNGRKPTEAELAQAAKNGFKKQSGKFNLTDSQNLMKIAAGLVVAIFGYVVGYLFM